MKKLLGILAAAVLTLGVMAPAASAAAPIEPLAVEMSVTIYENVNGWMAGGGDKWTQTNTPGNLKNASLVGDTTGLNSGCESVAYWPLGGPDWNDCVSAVKIAGMPANYKVVLYVNSNYGIRNHCYGANGSFNLNSVEADRTSSWRVEGGTC